ncbi:hypothetical protein ACIRF8_08235 [Streptomyces sp. NPDC102406]|uniref:hypothetical protein n=1 Tax=Streptomyces sp. NPDC102406 TaxID=3366171 RepID=UPI0037F69A44
MTMHYLAEARERAHGAVSRTARGVVPPRGLVRFCLACGLAASIVGALAAALVPAGPVRAVVWALIAALVAAAAGLGAALRGVRGGSGHRDPAPDRGRAAGRRR